MDFVLDNSVSMRWLLESEKSSDQKYAETVLNSLVEANALVPNLWHLEATARQNGPIARILGSVAVAGVQAAEAALHTGSGSHAAERQQRRLLRAGCAGGRGR